MTPIRSLLLVAAVFAAPVAAAADPPPATAEHKQAAGRALAIFGFLDEALSACSGQVPELSVRVGEVGGAWHERNFSVAESANAWLEQAIEDGAGGDEAKKKTLTDDVMQWLDAGMMEWAERSFGAEGVNGFSCTRLLDRLEARELELLGDPETAPFLRALDASHAPDEG